MLELAAQEADIVAINFNQRHGAPDAKAIMSDPANWDPGSHDQRIEWVRAAAGDRFDSLELAVLAVLQVTDDRERALSAAATAQGVTVEWLEAAPQFYFGTLDQIAAEMTEVRERWGISYFMTMAPDFEVTAHLIERLVQR
jgi:alkanesulfonate monooxygenase SsuD/methylene tetrahydromethanopterin reductase-like flavin-dependent oxidoreductase (luciferase family)